MSTDRDFEEQSAQLMRDMMQMSQLEAVYENRRQLEGVHREQEATVAELKELAKQSKLPPIQPSDWQEGESNEPTYRGRPVRYWIRLLSDVDTDVWLMAQEALKQMGDAAVPHIVQASLSGDNTIREKTRYCWTSSMALQAFPHFMTAIEHPDSSLRVWAIRGLTNIGSPARAAQPAIEKALKDAEESVRYWAVYALAAVGGKDAVPMLADLLHNRELRSAAVLALERIGKSAGMAVPHLLYLLEDADPELQKNVIDALRKIDPKAAVPHLLLLLENPDPKVQQLADDALRKIDPDALARHRSPWSKLGRWLGGLGRT